MNSQQVLSNIPPLTIGLIGCGKMGAALLSGWLRAGTIAAVHILDPGGVPEEFQKVDNIHYHATPEAFSSASTEFDMSVLAIKPQIMTDACQTLSLPGTLPILSIVAGKTIQSIQACFSEKQPVIRAMPNTPAAIGKGITVACASSQISPQDQSHASALLSAVGFTDWIDDESLMNAVTAVSGSGPAYVFYLIEVLAQAGEKAGLDPDFAMRLACQTVIGSAALAEASATTPATTLRQNVTSPGGTTEAALNVLMDGTMQALFDKAVEAAKQRGEDLSA